MSTTLHAPSISTQQLLGEIRDRLQTVHFAVRGVQLSGGPDALEPLADQLHAIRVLAEALDARLCS
jgi:hypothetical protein